MRVDNNKHLYYNQLKAQQIQRKQHLDELVRKERLTSERIKAQHIEKMYNDSIKGTNVDVSV